MAPYAWHPRNIQKPPARPIGRRPGSATLSAAAAEAIARAATETMRQLRAIEDFKRGERLRHNRKSATKKDKAT